MALTDSPQVAFLYSHSEARHWHPHELPIRQKTYSAGNFSESAWLAWFTRLFYCIAGPGFLSRRGTPDIRHFFTVLRKVVLEQALESDALIPAVLILMIFFQVIVCS